MSRKPFRTTPLEDLKHVSKSAVARQIPIQPDERLAQAAKNWPAYSREQDEELAHELGEEVYRIAKAEGLSEDQAQNWKDICSAPLIPEQDIFSPTKL